MKAKTQASLQKSRICTFKELRELDLTIDAPKIGLTDVFDPTQYYDYAKEKLEEKWIPEEESNNIANANYNAGYEKGFEFVISDTRIKIELLKEELSRASLTDDYIAQIIYKVFEEVKK